MKEFYDCITDFIFVENSPAPSDMIFVPGGNYSEAAQHAAKLYHEGWAPCIMPSGKYSITKGFFEPERPELYPHKYGTEFDFLRFILQQEGVPDSAILQENQATYTYENAIFSRRQTETLGIRVDRAILSCQAFHARRCLMYYQEQFPDTEFLVCPVVTKGISRENWYRTEQGIETVLGEVERCGGQFHEIMRRRL